MLDPNWLSLSPQKTCKFTNISPKFLWLFKYHESAFAIQVTALDIADENLGVSQHLYY